MKPSAQESCQARPASTIVSEGAEHLLHLIPVILVALDTDGKIAFINRKGFQTLGYEAGDLLGQDWFRFFLCHEHSEAVLDTIKEFIGGKGHADVSCEGYIVAKRGQKRHLTCRYSSIKGAAERITGVLFSGHDITISKSIEKALSESQLKLRAIFDQTYQFIGLMSPEGTLLEANRTALEFSGIKECDVLHKPFWECPWWTHSKELQERLRLATMAAAGGEFVRFEATHLAGDGSTHYIDFSLKPVRDAAGRIIYLIPEGRDITERKKAEEKVLASEHKLRAIANAATDAIIMTDDRDLICFWNVAATHLFGRPQADAMGQDMNRFLSSDGGPDAFMTAIAETAKDIPDKPAGCTISATGIPDDGRRFPAELSLTSVELDGRRHAIWIVHRTQSL